MSELEQREVEKADLVYLAVTKDAVPSVLGQLSSYAVGGVDLLIDTPVVRFKHFRHAAKADAFRNAWVAEDCTELPWFDAVRKAIDAGAIGKLKQAVFYQSAYAYHGVATAKALLGGRVRSGKRRRMEGRFAERTLSLSGGKQAFIHEPRDYAIGRFTLIGSKGTIADQPQKHDGDLVLEPVVADGIWTGFRVGDVTTRLDGDEIELMREGDASLSITARMDDLKRVGFLRLLRSIASGQGAYPIGEALDDMVVDYWLEKLGRYVATPLTSVRSGAGRRLLSLVTRAGG